MGGGPRALGAAEGGPPHGYGAGARGRLGAVEGTSWPGGVTPGPRGAWGDDPNFQAWGAGPAHAPPPHSREQACPFPVVGGWARAQCGGRSRVGMRPRPLSRGWEEDGGGQRSQRGVRQPATRSGPGPALTHPRAESGRGTDRGGGAHARRRGAEGSAHPAAGAARRAGTHSGSAGRRASPAARAQVRTADAAEPGAALARWPLAAAAPALREARAGNVVKFPVPGEPLAPGSPAGGRARIGRGRVGAVGKVRGRGGAP